MVALAGTLASLALLAIAVVALAAALRIRDRAAFAAAALVLGAAVIVLTSIVVSLFDALTRTGLLVAEAVVAAGAVATWAATGRPRPPAGWRPRRGTLPAAPRAHPLVALVLTTAGLALAIQAAMGIAVAPSTWDSMTYHLSRAAYWLQQHSAEHFPGGSLRQLGSPPNAEIIQAWTMAITGTDRFVALVQWLALIGLSCCVYLGARLLEFGRAPALFAAALFAVLPEPLLQAASTQNDLVIAFFVLAAAVFGVRGLRDRRGGDIAVAAAALGLAVGTKGTVFALGPSLAIVLLAAIWRYRPPPRLVAGAVAGAVCAVLALGSWGYALNVADGDPLFGGLVGKTQRETPVGENAVRVVWTFVDSPGVSARWFDLLATKTAHKTVGHLEIPNQFGFGVDTAISEDTSAYGLVGWLALFPLLLWFALRPKAPLRRAWAIAVLAGVAAFAVAFEFNIWVGRLLLPTVALAAPLLAWLGLRREVAAVAIAAVGVSLVPCLIVNPNKLLLVDEGQAKSIQKDRIAQMTALRPEMTTVLRTVESRIGPRDALAVVADEDSWDYPFFGEHRERRVVRFSDLASATSPALRRARVRAVLFENVGRPARTFQARQIERGYWLAPVR
jgi:4-amino-4-deoxy-L-arabinose transferase-like glycosyltransferase